MKTNSILQEAQDAVARAQKQVDGLAPLPFYTSVTADLKAAFWLIETVKEHRPDLLAHCERLLSLLVTSRIPGEITQTPEAIAELRKAVQEAMG